MASSPSHGDNGPDELTITQVAARLKKRYHRARDMMLSGKLGKTKYDGRKLTVSRVGVERYEEAVSRGAIE